MDEISRVPFKSIITFNASSSGYTASLVDLHTAGMGGRIADFALQFKKWRLTKLRVKGTIDTMSIATATSSPGVTLVSGYYGAPGSNVSGAQPTSTAEVMAFVHSDMTNGSQPLRYNVSPSLLAEARGSPWLFCAQTTGTPDVSVSAGTIFSGLQIGQALGAGSARAYVIISGECEFADPTTPTVMMNQTPFSGTVSVFPTVDDEEKIQSVISKATPKSVLKDPKLTAKEMTQLHFLLGRLSKGQKLPDMDSWADDCDSHQASEDEDDEKA